MSDNTAPPRVFLCIMQCNEYIKFIENKTKFAYKSPD